KIVLNKTEEPSIFWMLDHVCSSEERSPELQARKMAAKERIYGRQYCTLAEKYFGAFMNADARRCYWSAIKYHPRYLLSPGVTRRLIATLAGRGAYEWLKGLRSKGASARAQA